MCLLSSFLAIIMFQHISVDSLDATPLASHPTTPWYFIFTPTWAKNSLNKRIASNKLAEELPGKKQVTRNDRATMPATIHCQRHDDL